MFKSLFEVTNAYGGVFDGGEGVPSGDIVAFEGVNWCTILLARRSCAVLSSDCSPFMTA